MVLCGSTHGIVGTTVVLCGRTHGIIGTTVVLCGSTHRIVGTTVVLCGSTHSEPHAVTHVVYCKGNHTWYCKWNQMVYTPFCVSNMEHTLPSQQPLVHTCIYIELCGYIPTAMTLSLLLSPWLCQNMFEAVNKAYEFLCSKSSRRTEGPDPTRIVLLLQAQSILFQRYAEGESEGGKER